MPNSSVISAVEFIEQDSQLGAHCHHEAQLMLVLRGLVTCEVDQGLWLVPTQSALWIPHRTTHAMQGVGDLQIYCVYVDPRLTRSLPSACCVMKVSPLLRELIVELSHLSAHQAIDPPDERIIGLMLDRLAIAPSEQIHLPMPADHRLRRIAERLVADPSDRTTTLKWADELGMSERSLLRLLARNTGMSYMRWRRQFQIVFAMQRFAEGASVQTVAYALGYESSSAFVAMFRKAMGEPPMKFLAGRRADQVVSTARP